MRCVALCVVFAGLIALAVAGGPDGHLAPTTVETSNHGAQAEGSAVVVAPGHGESHDGEHGISHGEHESHACWASAEAAIHCAHYIHLGIDSPHMYHELHHLVTHNPTAKAVMQPAIDAFKAAQSQVASQYAELKVNQKTAMTKQLAQQTLAKANQALAALKAKTGALAAAEVTKLTTRISTITQSLSANSAAFAQAEAYIVQYLKAMDKVRQTFVATFKAVISSLARGAAVTSANVGRLVSTYTPKAVNAARTFFPAVRAAGGGVAKVVFSEGFGRSIIVVAALLEGYEKAHSTTATTTVGKTVNVVGAAFVSVVVMWNPWVALVDVGLSFIPGGEKLKPSVTLQCTVDALVAIGESVIVGEDSMLNDVNERMGDGRCGLLLQLANEAGRWWAEKGFVGGMEQFWDDLGWAMDTYVGPLVVDRALAFDEWRKEVGKFIVAKTDVARAAIGDVRPELVDSAPIPKPKDPGTYIKIEKCWGFDSSLDRPGLICRNNGVANPVRKTEPGLKRQDNKFYFEYKPSLTERGFGIFFRGSTDKCVNCHLQNVNRLWFDEEFTNKNFRVCSPPQGKRDQWVDVSLSGGGQCTIMYDHAPHN